MRKQRKLGMKPKLGWLWALSLCMAEVAAQETYPLNGVADKRLNSYAFTHATVVKDARTQITNATLVIKDGKIVALGPNVTIPKEAQVIDCSGKFIYPSLLTRTATMDYRR